MADQKKITKGVIDERLLLANVGDAIITDPANNVLGFLDERGILTIRIDTNRRLRSAVSGKSMLIVSTGGNRSVPQIGNNVKLGINMYAEGEVPNVQG